MTAQPVATLIANMAKDGLRLAVEDGGTLAYRGAKPVVEKHLPTLRARKPEIIAALKACRAHGATLSPAHWQARWGAHLAALKADASVVWVSEAVAESVAHLRTAWDWLADNDPPTGTYTEEECQERLARARVALSAAGVKPCIPLEALDKNHCERLRAEGRSEGAQELLDDLTERWGQMCGGPEYPDDAHALVAALEDVRERYTHANT
ncbi:MAG TPA: hypothetical protein DDX54_00335 [Rhodospirillaceae bacterium]|jgi:hypothetical protein|nr:hypothetical protein [Alphaproteobacteria bacterium]HBH25841.1 hypothetical protein [Rhodospirillaceae bacterium]